MKTLKNWLPQMGIGLIIISFLNLHFYYGSFGIQIQNYVEVSEIIFSLTVFISSIIYIAFISLGVVLFSKTPDKSPQKDSSTSKDSKPYLYFSAHKKKSLRWIRWFFDRFTITWYFLTIVLVALIYALNEGFPQKEILKYAGDFDLLYVMFIGYFSGYLLFLSLWYKRRIKPETSDLYKFTFLILISLVIYIGHRSNKSALLVKRGYPKFDAHLVTDDVHYTTNDTLVYVGATKNYYFLYDCKANVSTVIPSSEVKKAQFRRLRDGL